MIKWVIIFGFNLPILFISLFSIGVIIQYLKKKRI
ncbi:MAG: Loki-CTERM sorting domain-containing protein [Candidatus Hodarchaeales archaeon]